MGPQSKPINFIAALNAGTYLTGPYDANVVGSLSRGGERGNVDLVHVPEPSALALLALGFVGLSCVVRCH